jgi:two-component system, NarL family, response regulator NreC
MACVTKLSILIVDDHALVREGLKRLIHEQLDMLVVGEAGDGHEALRLAKERLPDVALVDIWMPGLDGASVTQMIMDACPQVKVIALTRHDDAGFVRKLLEAGATGYVLKQSALSELMQAVRAVAAGQQFVDASIRGAVPPSPSDPSRPEPAAAPEDALSSQEQSVLRLIAAAYTSQEIATSLSIDMTEVLATRSAAMAKAGLATLTDVVRYAQARGWL